MGVLQKEYSVSTLLNDVIDIIKTKMSKTTVRFVVSVDSCLPATLIGDEAEIRKILFTFLEAAVSSSNNGFISLFVFGKPLDKTSLELVIDVTCSGCSQQITSVVQDFNSNIELAVVNNPEKKNVLIYERREVYVNSLIFSVDNLGVDHTLVLNDDEFCEKIESRYYNYLFIAYALYKRNREIIEAYENKIKIIVISKLGESVPEHNYQILRMPAYCIAIADILNGEAKGFTAPGARVLIVDDVNINLQVVKVMLSPYKVQTDLCYNGKDAIEAVKSNQYDLIFMDYLMPGMNGIETAKTIRSFGNSYEKLPIIALTGNISDDSNKMFLENGFDDYISKPVNPEILDAVLEKWLPKDKQKS